MKKLMIGMAVLAFAGRAEAYAEWNLTSVTAKAGSTRKIVSANQFFDADYRSESVRDLNNERTVPSSTRFQITGTAFFESAFVIPFTAIGIAQADFEGIDLYSTDGSTTNFCYVGFFANTGGASVDAAFSNRTSIFGGIRSDGRNSWKAHGLAKSNKTGTLYIATADVLAQGIQRFEAVIWSRTNTR